MDLNQSLPLNLISNYRGLQIFCLYSHGPIKRSYTIIVCYLSLSVAYSSMVLFLCFLTFVIAMTFEVKCSVIISLG